MTKSNTGFRGFHHTGAAYYASAVLPRGDEVDSISIGLYHPEGGTTGEFNITWVQLGNGKPSPQLQVFNDAWAALALFGDLLAELAKRDNQKITPLETCDLLRALGLKDLTAYTIPKK